MGGFMRLLLLGPLLLCAAGTQAFHVHPPQPRHSSTTTRLHVFDFFRDRSQEGMDQLGNFAGKAKRGQWGAGLAEVASYTKVTNQAFADSLAKSRSQFLLQLESIFSGVDPEKVLDDLEDVLLQADIGAQTAQEILDEVKSLREDSTTLLSKEDLKSIMRGKLLEALDTGKSRAIKFSETNDPTVVMIIGANGMGKTTTIGKLAYRLRTEGNQTVLLAACDTFRAGAVDQLQVWADRAGVDQANPSDTAKKPSSVLYNALERGIEEKYDTVLVDTSGRLSNNIGLTEELVKMKRVIQRRLSVKNDADGKPIPNENVPHETLLVLDAAQGRMALDSAKAWDETVGLTGLILTKLDGSARGGSVVAITRDLGLPVKLVGVGERIEDLRDFEPESFVDGLLGIGASGGAPESEGSLMAARLGEMRRERDARAKTKPVKIPAKPKKPEMQLAGGGGISRSGGGNNKKKKRKRKKK